MSVIERIQWGRHGPRVVLVHGDVFDAPAAFAAMEPLAAHHRLILVNRRGFGASPAVDGEDFEVDARDLAFAALIGVDPSRLPTPLPDSLLRATRVQMQGRWPWDAVIPLEALAAATWPKLVVSGGHSRIFDLVCDVLQRWLPARREVFRGAGHSIPRLGDPVNECLARLWASSAE
jgi:pimeloyl-ACP methyl ester carboxylesterase